jgi:hypothetical protein
MSNVSFEELCAIEGGGACYSATIDLFGLPIGIHIGDCPMNGNPPP